MHGSVRINPLHIAHLPANDPSPLPSPVPFARLSAPFSPAHSPSPPPPPPHPTHPASSPYASYLDTWSLNELCVPGPPLLSELWQHYQGGVGVGVGGERRGGGVLPFVGLSGFARDVTLRVLAFHEGRGRGVGRAKEREAVLPGYEHGSVEESVMCVMKEVGRRMGTRIDRRVWDERVGGVVYAVWTRKDREEEHRHRMRMKRGRRKVKEEGAHPRRSNCTLM